MTYTPFVLGAWVANRAVTNNWIRAEFATPKYVFESITQGRDGSAQYITSYTLSYGFDGLDMQPIVENADVKEFEGTLDANDKLLHEINIYAQYIQLNIIGYNSYPALRWGLIGCC